MYSNVLLSVVLIACATAYERTFSACHEFKLDNGRMRIKPKGKLAKFQCNRGYMLAGEKYSYCMKGKFDVPPPVCVKPTCTKIKQLTNGLILAAYNGGVMNFYCKPGFTMRGPNISYCDGVRWSHNLPACISTHIPTPTSCDFETEDLCGWSHDLNHDFDWRRQNFQTPSGHIGTGPRFDHTKGEAKDGYYMYIESTSRLKNDMSRLISPVYSPYRTGVCFTFWYHMYGRDMGKLNIYIRRASQQVWGSNTRGLKPLWTREGNLGDVWRRGKIEIADGINEEFQIIIEGIRGSSYISDIAIDDVELTETCAEDEEETFSTTTESSTDEDLEVNYGSCENRCNETGGEIVLSDAGSCECNENCYFRNTCCPDYKIVCLEVAFDEFSTEFTEEYYSTTEMDSESSTIVPDIEINKTLSITTSTSENIITKPTTDISIMETQTTQQPENTIILENTTAKVIINNTGNNTKTDKPNIKNDTSTATTTPVTEKVTTANTPKNNIVKPTKPTVKSTVKPTVKSTVKPTVKSTVKPTVKSTVKPTVKSTVKPTVKSTIKPVPKIDKNINNVDKTNTVNKNTTIFNNTTSKKIQPVKIASTTVSTTTKLAPTTSTKQVTETDFITSFGQQTIEIETDFEGTTVQTILQEPKMEMHKDKSVKQQENNSSNLTFVILGSGSVILICIIIAVAIFVKFNAQCHNLRLRNNRNSDSMSDVRFLASDEVLDFTWRASTDM